MYHSTTKSYIWSTPNTIAHILLIVLFLGAYISADDDFLEYHTAFALLFGFVILFRIFWGFIGPKYSKFKDFVFDFTALKEYLSSPFQNIKHYVGHNPASSWAIILIFVLGILTIFSGLLAFGTEHHHGVFAMLYTKELKELKIFEEIHEVVANLLIAVIIVHIVGALVDKYIKKNDAIDSMISGYKTTQIECSITTSTFQRIFFTIFVILFILFASYLFFIPENIFISNLASL